MEKIKVSVVIPVYNSEKYLKKCLNSVIYQTLKETEIICVDDGSTDSSAKILNEFAEKDSRFILISQENKFAGAARNRGLEAAGGKYIVFWDADDYFEKNALEIMYTRCERTKADICLCGAASFDSESGKRAIDETFLKRRFLPREKVFSAKTHPQYIFNAASNVPWQRMFCTSFIKEKKIKFQNLRQANDTYFVMAAMYYAERITYTEKPLVNYRTNNKSSITGKASASPLCAYESFAAVYELLRAEGCSEQIWQSFYNKLVPGLIRGILLQTTEGGIQEIYSKIKNEGISYFGIDKHLSPEYYYFQNEYEDLIFILNHSACEYLIYKYQKENRDKLFYKAKAEKSFLLKIARKCSRYISADSRLYDAAKKFLHLK
ncbi:MAG: glycosyltransferase [Eubacterium sp.]